MRKSTSSKKSVPGSPRFQIFLAKGARLPDGFESIGSIKVVTAGRISRRVIQFGYREAEVKVRKDYSLRILRQSRVQSQPRDLLLPAKVYTKAIYVPSREVIAVSPFYCWNCGDNLADIAGEEVHPEWRDRDVAFKCRHCSQSWDLLFKAAV